MDSRFNHTRPSVAHGAPWWTGILPWMAFGVAQKWCPPLAGPLALTVFGLLNWRTRQALPALDAGIGVYFCIYSVISLAGEEPTLPPQVLFALCPAVLAVAAALSVTMSRPFTLAYARRYVPEHLSTRHSFFQAQQIISSFWAMGFAAAAIAINARSGEWQPTQAAFILISVLGVTSGASVAIGVWLHLRLPRVAL